MGRILVVMVMLLVAEETRASGAGRAFPIESENYIIQRFNTIDPYIEWDPTNFLVNLAGWYANCKNIRGGTNIRDGYEMVLDKWNRDGRTIGVLYGYLKGSGTDWVSVDGYLHNIIDGWVANRSYHYLIQGADRFGCSVRPGCSGFVTVACLFSPADGLDDYVPTPQPPRPPTYRTTRPTNPPRTRRTRKPTRETTKYTPTRRPRTSPWPITRITRRTTLRSTPIWTYAPTIRPKLEGQAFTKEQYDFAEGVTTNQWDRSHFLENLSGYEISCAMLYKENWPFTKSISVGREHGHNVLGLKGHAPNKGSTPDALRVILDKFKGIEKHTEVGCSVIPDCINNLGEMWVIVACIYEQ